MDADAALACLKELNDIACVVVKHANPCGVSLGKNTLEAYSQAFDADSLSAFGGVVALNRECTQAVATSISEVFIEIIMAPSFDDESLIIFSKKKNLRVLEVGQITKRKKNRASLC